MDQESSLRKAMSDAVRYSARVTPFVVLWFALAFVRSYRGRGILAAAAHESVKSAGLFGLTIIGLVFAVTLALRLAGLREADELPPHEAMKHVARERVLRRLMWVIAAIVLLGLLISVG